MRTLIQDVRYGLRVLARSPGFTLVAVLTLALGIGANTALFSTVNSLILRSLPVKEPERLVVLAARLKGSSNLADLSYADYIDYRNQANVFTDMLGYEIGQNGLAADGRAERVIISYVTGNYFSMLGVQPALGRLIEPGEGQRRAADSVLVLGYSFWQRRFNGDPKVIGKVVLVNGRQPVTIVGVVPKVFHGTFALAETDAYLSLGQLAFDDAGFWTKRGRGDIRALARLKPGISLEEARASLNVIAQRLAQQYPDADKNLTLEVYPERYARPQADAANEWPPMVAIFLSLALIVLLVACMNVANLLLMRAKAREGEMAIRLALGAAHARLIRQFLTENVLLALVGGAAGILLSLWVTKVLSVIATPLDFPFFQLNFQPDWRVFAYALCIAVATGIFIGFIPARRVLRSSLSGVLHEGARTVSGGPSGHRARNALVIAQIAGSAVLLIAAGLFVRSLEKAEHSDLGFDPHRIVNLGMDLADVGYNEAQGEKFYREVIGRVRALPGVQSAAYVHSVPLYHDRLLASISVEGRTLPPGQPPPEIFYNIADPGVFETLRIPILRGRGFGVADTDSVPKVAIISQAMAERFWPGENALGKRFRMGSRGPLWEVIGVARDAQFVSPTPRIEPYFYVPLAQHYNSFMTLQARSSLPASTLINEIERQVRSLEPNLPLFDVRTMEEELNGATGFFLFHVGADVAGGLGTLGLLLAVIGVYGVVSYAASQRTHEIGLRMAVGANRSDILRMVFRHGLCLVGSGLGLGLLLALAASQGLSSLLVGVSPFDPVTYSAASLLLGGVALFASYIPARRATKVDPLVALRYE